MPEMLQPESSGISGLLDLARMIFPPDHEFMGFEDENGVFYSLEQLKALEGREIEMEKANSLKEKT